MKKWRIVTSRGSFIAYGDNPSDAKITFRRANADKTYAVISIRPMRYTPPRRKQDPR